MESKLWLRPVVFVFALLLSAAVCAAQTDEPPMVTGEHWVKSSDEAKKAYLIGIANVLQIEHAYQATSPPTDAQSLVPRWAKGLKGQTLDTVRDQLNRWYAAHPDHIRRPVLETIWFEIVVPGSSKPS